MTMFVGKFRGGDRVKLSAKGVRGDIAILSDPEGTRLGTIVADSRPYVDTIYVRWDGNKQGSRMHEDFLELAPQDDLFPEQPKL